MNYSLATISSKRQLTIPKAFRARLGIAPGDRVMLTVQGGGIRFTPLHGSIVAALDDETEMRLPCPLFALRSFALSGAPYNFAEAVAHSPPIGDAVACAGRAPGWVRETRAAPSLVA